MVPACTAINFSLSLPSHFCTYNSLDINKENPLENEEQLIIPGVQNYENLQYEKLTSFDQFWTREDGQTTKMRFTAGHPVGP